MTGWDKQSDAPPPADRVLAVPARDDDLLALFALDTGERLGEVPVGSHPVHATTCRGRTVVATMGDRAVTAVDASGEVTQIETGVLGPSHFAAANGELYVSCSAGDALAVIDSERLTLVDRVAVGAEPHEVAVAPDGDRLYSGAAARASSTSSTPSATSGSARSTPARTPGCRASRSRRTGTGDTRSTSAARGCRLPSRPVTIRVLSPSKSRSTPRPRSAPTRTTSSRPVTGCSSPAAATVSSTSSTGSWIRSRSTTGSPAPVDVLEVADDWWVLDASAPTSVARRRGRRDVGARTGRNPCEWRSNRHLALRRRPRLSRRRRVRDRLDGEIAGVPVRIGRGVNSPPYSLTASPFASLRSEAPPCIR